MAAPVKAESFLDLIKNRRTYYALNKSYLSLRVASRRLSSRTSSRSPRLSTPSPTALSSSSVPTTTSYGISLPRSSRPSSPLTPGNHRSTYERIQGWCRNRKSYSSRTRGRPQDAGPVLSIQRQFPIWALQSDAMIQFRDLDAFTAEGLGANLQHYNPLIDAKVASEWGIPDNWQLNAQLVFGGRAGEPGPKDQLPIEDRLKVFGA
ncbi:putative nitroreductase family protein [Daldinia childiae]|nr:putative nitroreductase family protein [Daldinia childiae]KAF3063820.1 putative nitroreductase family protein [Daldinia childiae]